MQAEQTEMQKPRNVSGNTSQVVTSSSMWVQHAVGDFGREHLRQLSLEKQAGSMMLGTLETLPVTLKSGLLRGQLSKEVSTRTSAQRRSSHQLGLQPSSFSAVINYKSLYCFCKRKMLMAKNSNYPKHERWRSFLLPKPITRT